MKTITFIESLKKYLSRDTILLRRTVLPSLKSAVLLLLISKMDADNAVLVAVGQDHFEVGRVDVIVATGGAHLCPQS